VMSRLHRGRRQPRDLLTEYAKERGFLRTPRPVVDASADAAVDAGASDSAAEPAPVGAWESTELSVGDERKVGPSNGGR